MPSPFPGMDPYLELELWTSFHALFVPEIIRFLTPQLRPRYIALAQKYPRRMRNGWMAAFTKPASGLDSFHITVNT